MNELEKMKANVESLDAELEDVSLRRKEAVDAYDTARVEAMNPELVAEAENYGISPRNFENDDHLKQAIELQKSNGVKPSVPEVEDESNPEEKEQA